MSGETLTKDTKDISDINDHETHEEDEKKLRIARKRDEKRKRRKKNIKRLEKKLQEEERLEKERKLALIPELYDIAIFREMTHSESKRELIALIGNGAQKAGAKLHDYEKMTLSPSLNCTVALIFSYSNTIISKPDRKPRHLFREKIVKHQEKNGQHCLFVDSDVTACYSYKDGNRIIDKIYVRLSLESIYPDKANYMIRVNNSDIQKGLSRWNKLCDQKNIRVKPWKSYPTSNTSLPILICHQSNSGFLMGETDPLEWLIATVTKIRTHTQRKIIIRLPQNAFGKGKSHDLPEFSESQNITFSTVKSLQEDVARSMSVVVHSSSAAICPIVEGVALFATSPKCFASSIANTDLAKIENPATPNRDKFFSLIGHCHWTLEELEDGSYWNRVKSFIS